MVNLLDKLYSLKPKYKLLEKLRLYSLLRFTIRSFSNLFLPIYFNLTYKNSKYRLASVEKYSNRVIVSLTSFPARINNIWLVIETILRQKNKPDMIILWLSKEQFSNLESLPIKLLKQRERGLLIKLVDDDLRSHKKYYYAFQKYPNDIIITVDDDVFYSPFLLTHLLELHKEYSSSIICNHATRVIVENEQILPYLKWKTVIGETGLTYEIMPIGVGGVLYPPKSLDKNVSNFELFKKMCFNADDIWLNVMARLNKTQSVKTNYSSNYLPVFNKQNQRLTDKNVYAGNNDNQLNNVRNYYIKNKKIDPFSKLLK